MPKKLKIETWLKKLPEPHRSLALKNRKSFPKRVESETSLAAAVWNGFSWSSTPEGGEFWQGVYHWAVWTPAPPRPKLPNLPKKKK